MRESIVKRIDEALQEVKDMNELQLAEWLAIEIVKIEYGTSKLLGRPSRYRREGAKMLVGAVVAVRGMELAEDAESMEIQ